MKIIESNNKKLKKGTFFNKIKLLVCVCNFESYQLQELHTLLNEYNNMEKFICDVYLMTTVDVDTSIYKNLKIVKKFYDKKLGHRIPMLHRSIISENVNKYDFYIYSESDILITEKNINWYINKANRIPQNFITGFIRYEYRKNSDVKYLPDINAIQGLLFNNKHKINDTFYVTLTNIFSACYILNNSQLQICINSGQYNLESIAYDGYGIIESAAATVYTRCGLIKVTPVHIEETLIHHLSDKYAYYGPGRDVLFLESEMGKYINM